MGRHTDLSKEGFLGYMIGMLGYKPRGSYQTGAINVLFSDKEYVVLQGPRQSYKSFITSLYCSYAMLNGKSVVITAETKSQANRSVSDDITDHIDRVIGDMNLEYDKKNRNEVILSRNGSTHSRMYTVSSQTTSSQGIKDIDIVVVDEAQDVPYSVVSSLITPFVAEPRAQGEEVRIVALGIGSPKNMYLRRIKEKKDSAVHSVTCYDVADEYPGYKKNIEDARQTMNEDDFAKHMLCEDFDVNEGRLLEGLNQYYLPKGRLEYSEHYKGELYFGVDLGQRDSTCVVVVGYDDEGHVDIVDGMEMSASTHGDNWLRYAESIADFIDQFYYKPENVIIEGNFNDAIRDVLNDELETGRRDLRQTEFLSRSKKTKLARQLKYYNDQGMLRINTDFDNFRGAYEDLRRVSYEYKGKHMVLSHSDWVSALLMAAVPRSEVEVTVV